MLGCLWHKGFASVAADSSQRQILCHAIDERIHDTSRDSSFAGSLDFVCERRRPGCFEIVRLSRFDSEEALAYLELEEHQSGREQ